ncbi:MAG: 3-keto-5-aminohexanoate cleavage protein [Boseongicola sp.]|nr:3-keto-5-aminohexanoate cleavage protein [Boseongicola sp.]
MLPKTMVAPTGARMSKADHPALPISEVEIVDCAVDCHNSGAGGIHVHIRGSEGEHLLDGRVYRRLADRLRAVVPNMLIQITTEAAGRYEPHHQMETALKAGVDHVSVSIREICRASTSDVTQFIERCASRGIAVQWILYDTSDAKMLQEVLTAPMLRSTQLQLLFVLGQYGKSNAVPQDLDPFLDWISDLELTPDWAACAFGEHEPACLKYAATKGGKCRVGFENSLHLSTGEIADSNAQKIVDLRDNLKNIGE